MKLDAKSYCKQLCPFGLVLYPISFEFSCSIHIAHPISSFEFYQLPSALHQVHSRIKGQSDLAPLRTDCHQSQEPASR